MSEQVVLDFKHGLVITCKAPTKALVLKIFKERLHEALIEYYKQGKWILLRRYQDEPFLDLNLEDNEETWVMSCRFTEGDMNEQASRNT